MICTPLTRKAIWVAFRAHAGQVDKAGLPYILHPLQVAERMTDELGTCVALLHEVVEDTAVTPEDLRMDFPPEVVEAVRLLTHNQDVPYADYVRALAGNPLARAVKIADLAHNSDESRFAGLPVDAEALARRRAKYFLARSILGGEE